LLLGNGFVQREQLVGALVPGGELGPALGRWLAELVDDRGGDLLGGCVER
jgi:hypothetical protein